MGRLTYDSTNAVEFEDRLLAHLQIVIGQKIRFRESFYFSWKNDPKAGDGRCTIWLTASMPLHFTYTTRSVPSINREWLAVLLASANSPDGLVALPEPRQDAAPPARVPTGRVSAVGGVIPGQW